MFKKFMCVALSLMMVLCTISTVGFAADYKQGDLIASHVTFTADGKAAISVKNVASTGTQNAVFWLGEYVDGVLVESDFEVLSVVAGAAATTSELKVTKDADSVLKAYIWEDVVRGKAIAPAATYPSSSTEIKYAFKDGKIWADFKADTYTYDVELERTQVVMPDFDFYASDNSTVVVEPESYVLGENVVKVIAADGTSVEYKINISYKAAQFKNFLCPLIPESEIFVVPNITFSSGNYTNKGMEGASAYLGYSGPEAEGYAFQNIGATQGYLAGLGYDEGKLFVFRIDKTQKNDSAWFQGGVGKYDGTDGKYFLTFDIDAAGTMYVCLNEMFYRDTGVLPDEAPFIANFVKEGYKPHATMNSVYYKEYKAGETVQVPAMGWSDTWDGVVDGARAFKNPSYFMFGYDEDPTAPPASYTDTKLKSFTYTIGGVTNTVDGFDASVAGGDYIVNVPGTATQVSVAAEKNGEYSEISISETELTLTGGKAVATVTVVAPDSSVAKYTVTFMGERVKAKKDGEAWAEFKDYIYKYDVVVERDRFVLPKFEFSAVDGLSIIEAPDKYVLGENVVKVTTPGEGSVEYKINLSYRKAEFKNFTSPVLSLKRTYKVPDVAVSDSNYNKEGMEGSCAYLDYRGPGVTSYVRDMAPTRGFLSSLGHTEGELYVFQIDKTQKNDSAWYQGGVGKYDGTDGNYFLSFELEASGTMYVRLTETDYAPAGTESQNQLTANLLKEGYAKHTEDKVYYKKYNAGETVKVPAMGWCDTWDEATLSATYKNRLFMNPAYFMFGYDSDPAADPEMPAEFSDTTLQSFTYTVDGDTKPVDGFSAIASERDYEVVLPKGTTTVSVAAEKGVKESTITISETDLTIVGGTAKATVTVTAFDGSVGKHTVTFTVAKSSDATLKNVKANGKDVVFNASRIATVEVYEGDALPTVTYETNEADATAVATTEENITTIVVTAEDGTKLTYKVKFVFVEDPSVSLSGVTVNGKAAELKTEGSDTYYYAEVASDVTVAAIVAAAKEITSTVTYDPSANPALEAGEETVVKITVSNAASKTKDYIVKILRGVVTENNDGIEDGGDI